MVEKKLSISIEGAEDIFKDLDKSIQRLTKSLDTLTKKQKAYDTQSKRAGDKEKKRDVGAQKAVRTFNTLGKVFGGNIKALSGLAGGLTKAVPHLAVAKAATGALWEALKKLYYMTLAQNRLVLETGDVFAFLDTSIGDTARSVKNLRSQIQTATFYTGFMIGTAKEHIEAMKGYQEAGLILDTTSGKFAGLAESTKFAIMYGTLFSLKTEQMAKIIGEFTREMLFTGDVGREAFSEIFNASVKARYGTRNFLGMVQQTIPTMGYFGGSVNEVSRLLQFMGRTGVISMRQAKESIGALTTGVKELNAERRIELAALVGQENMVNIITGTLNRLKRDMGRMDKTSKSYMVAQMQFAELSRDLTAAQKGDFIAMGETVKRMGAAGAMEMVLRLPERFLGMQMNSLDSLINLTGQQRYMAGKALEKAGLTEKHLEILKKMATTAGGEGVKTREQFINYLRNNTEEIKKQMETDEEKARRLRQMTQDRIANALENIAFAVMNEIAPYVQLGVDVLLKQLSRIKALSNDVAEMDAIRKILKKESDEFILTRKRGEVANKVLQSGKELTKLQTTYLEKLVQEGAEAKLEQGARLKELTAMAEESKNVNIKLLRMAGTEREIKGTRRLIRGIARVGGALAGGILGERTGAWIGEKIAPSIGGGGGAAPAARAPTNITLNQTIIARSDDEAARKVAKELMIQVHLRDKRAD